MAVVKSRRGESPVQFLETARELEVYTLTQCARFPKAFMFLITQELAQLARGVLNDIKSANSIFPANAAEVQMRLDFWTAANCKLQCLVSQLDIARQLITHTAKNKPIHETVWRTWAELIARASVVRMRRKLKTFREWVRAGKMTPFDAYASFQSWASGLMHANAYTSLNAMRRLFDGLFAGV